MNVAKWENPEQFNGIAPGFYVWFTSRDEALSASIAGEPIETTPRRLWRAQVSERYFKSLPKEEFPR